MYSEDQVLQQDAIVIGGGMVGATVALGLSQAGWRVALVDKHELPCFTAERAPDIRVSALSARSVGLLKKLGAWQAILAMRATPYRQLETWEFANNKVVFSHRDLGIPELGYMIENHVVQRGIWQQFSRYPQLQAFPACHIEQMVRHEGQWYLQLANQQTVVAPLVIGADGAHSQVRQLVGIGVTGWQYRQTCMLITIKQSQVAGDVTWQQFTPHGPRAYLPLFDHWASLVWYDHPERINTLKSLSLANLKREIQANFPHHLSDFTVHECASFELVRRHAQSYYRGGCVLVGDAAHTINPLAGQGANLGFRDVSALIDVLISAREQGHDVASDTILQRYQCCRYPDNLLMQTAMDGLYSAFSTKNPLLMPLRNFALFSAQRAGFMKRLVLQYAVGL